MNDDFIPAPISDLDRVSWSDDAMHEAVAITTRWNLDLHAVVGTMELPPGGLSEDALHRVGCLVGIDRALEVVLGPDQGREWLHRPNAGLAFGSRSPIDLMENDGLAGLLRVRGVLDGWKVGVFSPPLDDPGMPVMRLRWAPA